MSPRDGKVAKRKTGEHRLVKLVRNANRRKLLMKEFTLQFEGETFELVAVTPLLSDTEGDGRPTTMERWAWMTSRNVFLAESFDPIEGRGEAPFDSENGRLALLEMVSRDRDLRLQIRSVMNEVMEPLKITQEEREIYKQELEEDEEGNADEVPDSVERGSSSGQPVASDTVAPSTPSSSQT